MSRPLRTLGRIASACSRCGAGLALATFTAVSIPAAAEGLALEGTGYAASAPRAAHTVESNMRLSFSTSDGTAIPVHVVVTDGAGVTWFDQTARDPTVAATIPPGQYLIAATYNGRRVARSVSIVRAERYVGHFAWGPDGEGPPR